VTAVGTDTRQDLRRNVLRVAAWLRGELRDVLEPFGLTPPQYEILGILRSNAPAPLSTLQIRERAVDPASDASRLVDRLVTKGLVEKAPCCDDRRLVDVTITPAGVRLLGRIEADRERLDAPFRVLDEVEARTLARLLRELLDRAGAQTPG
jgi:DNA-binding MarR family transcriptional regulator